MDRHYIHNNVEVIFEKLGEDQAFEQINKFYQKVDLYPVNFKTDLL